MIPIGDLTRPHRRGYVTWLLVAVNAVVFFGFQLAGDACDQMRFLYEYSAIPRELTTLQPLSGGELAAALQGCPTDGIEKNIALSAVTSAFLHGSTLHLFGNLIYLVVFGDDVESRIGHLRFAGFTLLGAVAATSAHALVQPASTTPLVGASGLVAAILGAYLLCFPRATVLTLVPFPLYVLTWFVPGLRTVRFYLIAAVVTFPAWLLLLGWFALQVTAVQQPVGDPVAYDAHIAGFLAGIAMILIIDRRRRRRGRTPFHPPRRTLP